MKATQARTQFFQILKQVNSSHAPITVSSKTGNVVILAESDWKAIQETLYLTSIPGMKKSIIEGMAQAIDECESELDW